jgi:hypothetical protein
MFQMYSHMQRRNNDSDDKKEAETTGHGNFAIQTQFCDYFGTLTGFQKTNSCGKKSDLKKYFKCPFADRFYQERSRYESNQF